MSEEITRGRSPSCPQIPLSKAIEMVKNLHAKAGKAAISRETAVGPLGFSGMHGAALTALSVLSQYGLIDAERGGSLRVSDLARRLMHPLSEKQESDSKTEAALRPKVFNELFKGGYGDCDEGVLANHLVQSGFTLEGARKVASVFKANAEFANLGTFSMISDSNAHPLTSKPENFADEILNAIRAPLGNAPIPPQDERRARTATELQPHSESAHRPPVVSQGGRVLAQYSIPLGENEATLVFTGTRLTPDDFDALSDYVDLFKKQFVRAQAGVAVVKAAFAASEIQEVSPSRDVRDDLAAYHPGVSSPYQE